jgi:hypothetical protein
VRLANLIPARVLQQEWRLLPAAQLQDDCDGKKGSSVGIEGRQIKKAEKEDESLYRLPSQFEFECSFLSTLTNVQITTSYIPM